MSFNILKIYNCRSFNRFKLLRSQGATIVEVSMPPLIRNAWATMMGKVVDTEFRDQIETYLAQYNAPVKSVRWFLDEVFLTINGRLHYLWRAVDQDGEVIDILVQKRKDKRAAQRFFKKILKKQGRVPFELMTDKLRNYGSAKKEVMPSVTHIKERYSNNRAENSHQRTRQQERQMRGFKSHKQAQLFLSVHGSGE